MCIVHINIGADTQWMNIGNMAWRPAYHSMVTGIDDNFVYVMGGMDSSATNECLMIDTTNNPPYPYTACNTLLPYFVGYQLVLSGNTQICSFGGTGPNSYIYDSFFCSCQSYVRIFIKIFKFHSIMLSR